MLGLLKKSKKENNNIPDEDEILSIMMDEKTNIIGINNNIELMNYIILKNYDLYSKGKYNKIIIHLHVERFNKK